MLEMLANPEGLDNETLTLHVRPGIGRQRRTGSRPILQPMSNDQAAKMTEGGTVRLAFTVDGTLWPGNMNLGVAISVDDHPSYLTVESLCSSGLIAHWNDTHVEEERVCRGDFISCVNDRAGTAHLEMLNQIDDAQKLSIRETTRLRLRIEPGGPFIGQCKAGRRLIFC